MIQQSSEQQMELVKALTIIKNKIQKSDNKKDIFNLTQEAIDAAIPVLPVPRVINGREYNIEGKERILALLTNELTFCKEEYNYDLETIHFQLAGSLAMLSLKYINGGIGDLNELSENL